MNRRNFLTGIVGVPLLSKYVVPSPVVPNATTESSYDAAYDWSLVGRKNQQFPVGNWDTWVIITGRGWGKSRTSMEWVRHSIESCANSHIGVVGVNARDARFLAETLLKICPPSNRPVYSPVRRSLTWDNGSVVYLYSAERPDDLRGPSHDGIVLHELCSYQHDNESSKMRTCIDSARFALRKGSNPRMVIATTPKPVQPFLEIIKSRSSRMYITRGTSMENLDNMDESTMRDLLERYNSTKLWLQEIYGEVIL